MDLQSSTAASRTKAMVNFHRICTLKFLGYAVYNMAQDFDESFSSIIYIHFSITYHDKYVNITSGVSTAGHRLPL